MIYEGVLNNQMRFYRALSSDGLHFAKTAGALTSGAVLLPESDESDFVSVPELIRVDAHTLRIYFVAKGDHTESARSLDEGMTWIREGDLVIQGLSSGQWVVDPDLMALVGGQFRLFFVTPPDGVAGLSNKRIKSALSSDGLTFVLETGDRVGVENGQQDLVDPDVVQLTDGTYRMYFGKTEGTGGTYDLKSAVHP